MRARRQAASGSRGRASLLKTTGARPGLHGPPWDPFLVDVASASARRLALLGEDDAAVAWSPDGCWLAVSGLGGLHFVSVADGSVRTLPAVATYGGLDWR